MIGRLTGIIVEQGLDGSCIVDVGGVGYEVHVPLGTPGRLPQPPAPAVIHIHTQLREDALTLYGFATLDDRSAFRTLISVTGIGPKLALGILSSLSAHELADAIHRGDRNRFKNVSGVGKKLVERLVLELKDKFHFGTGSVPAAPVRLVTPPAFASTLGTVHGALVQMGFKPIEAERAIEQITPSAAHKPTEELLREALAFLS